MSAAATLWKTLLVPHDFSTAAARAHALAAELAGLTGGKLVLLHVSPVPHGLKADTKIVPDGAAAPVRIDEYMTAAARRKLEEAAAKVGAPAAIRTVLAGGDAAETILEQAAAVRADVIVMGTHGRTGVQRLLLGSVAERVLRHSNVPVVVVRDSHPEQDEHLREEEAVLDQEDG